MKVVTRHNKGFTLMELMVTIAIFAIMVTLAAPGLREMVIGVKLDAIADNFETALSFARSEAIKRGSGSQVTVCKSANNTNCTTSGNWNQGYIVFIDTNGTVGVVDGGDVVLRVQGPLLSYSLVGSTDVANYISYVSSGRAQLASGATQSGTLALTLTADASYARTIVLSNTGRACVVSSGSC